MAAHRSLIFRSQALISGAKHWEWQRIVQMTDNTARRPEDAAAEPEAQGAERGRTPQTEQAKVAALVETLARENAEHKDRLLRTLAEMENLRKRTEREVADMRQYGIASFARDMLAVADNMERALEALDAELRETANPAVKTLLDGVELTERELLKVLEKHGVTKFEPQEGRQVRSQSASGDVRAAGSLAARRHRRAGGAARLHDRRADVAAGAGRRRQRWAQARARQRQSGLPILTGLPPDNCAMLELLSPP